MADFSVIGYNPNLYKNSGSSQFFSNTYYQKDGLKNNDVMSVSQPDMVILNTNNRVKRESNKRGLSSNAKLGLGSLVLVGLGAAAYLLTRGKVGSKSVQQLAEHIDFKEAKTLEEAVEFGKTHLAIKDYRGFQSQNVDVINWINEGIVNISNKMKGKSKIPKTIIYENIDAQTMLAVNRKGDVLMINKSVFEDLDAAINNYLNDGSWVQLKNGKYSFPEIYSRSSMKELLVKLHNFKNNKFNFKEKIELFENLQMVSGETNSFLSNPVNKIKTILKNAEAKDRLSKIGLEVDIEKISKMTSEQQENLLISYIKDANIKKEHELISRFYSIYHEFGHLNDTNLLKRAGVKAVYDINKETYPSELAEWLNDIKKQKIAGEVSSYATENPAEFIAETFAKLFEGRKLSDDVISLYKEYGGPAL